VVCSEDEEKEVMWVNYYLYHTSEKTLRFTSGGTPQTIEIERTGEPFYRIPFSDMLARYGVKYTDTSTLDDLETEFWKAFFADPNDEFDDDQYCHSPWFDRCCGDRRTVSDLKKAGNWDDVWFKMKPRKTINYLHAGPPVPLPPPPAPPPLPSASPTQIQVAHFDFNTLVLRLLAPPVPQSDPDFPAPDPAKTPELKVMVLLNAGAGVKIQPVA